MFLTLCLLAILVFGIYPPAYRLGKTTLAALFFALHFAALAGSVIASGRGHPELSAQILIYTIALSLLAALVLRIIQRRRGGPESPRNRYRRAHAAAIRRHTATHPRPAATTIDAAQPELADEVDRID
ncbi:hypothetical protein [Corynebacterium aquilae]|uniref:Uncharacterized protein n=1 Tax=Corynebacterium aquilae DSM 44791 TaxID=1431546 RepID=A0A1L7CDM7_9CORY|nr:hypothetical protein [Corynebacterium aquilae]APT83936.1 hypothetical protein CAQU_01335 [Corynebacterium aquilae DSM 44791]